MSRGEVTAALIAIAFGAVAVVGVVALGVIGHNSQPVPAVVAAHLENEVIHGKRLAVKYRGRAEVVMEDGTRVDILTDCEAIEIDWAPKHYEAVGQALWYSILTGKEPAIILLVEREGDQRHVDRCRRICKRVGIKLYTEDVTSGSHH